MDRGSALVNVWLLPGSQAAQEDRELFGGHFLAKRLARRHVAEDASHEAVVTNRS